ncbi:unnamed protein product [Anisakis simplex]|uniref:Uncharacterized protein n=1 Tax=Anisakis simplex TaxID=6269 RepID=A0A0M3KFX0_ANISI|nr:unnamed protein product [Anisakis simplex]
MRTTLQASYCSTQANAPFVFTIQPPTPSINADNYYSEGMMSPYRAAYREALSTACYPFAEPSAAYCSQHTSTDTC